MTKSLISNEDPPPQVSMPVPQIPMRVRHDPSEYAKVRFKALMVEVRYLSENADVELAQIMHRELEREIGILIPKFRTGNDFLKNRIVAKDDIVVESRPTG